MCSHCSVEIQNTLLILYEIVLHFQVKSQQILTDLKENGKQLPAATGVNSMFRCAICDIMLNSSQQLAMHLSGRCRRMAL